MGKEGDQPEPQDRAGQRRHVALLFSDLCDYTSLTESRDVEYTVALRGPLEELAKEICARHGGAVTQCYGDGLLMVFGLPSSHEHDVRAAIETALDLREATRSARFQELLPSGFELRMHFGVHSGLVFARIGDPLHGTYDLTGDTVNTAKRLCEAAQRDEIFVSENALRGIEPFFDADRVPELALKGKRMRLRAYRVQNRSDVRTRFEASSRRGLTGFVNRTVELQQLSAAMAEARDNDVRIIGLIGGAGIGKSRVLEEFLHSPSTRDAHVYRGFCENYGAMTPLQPLVQILRQLFGIDSETPLEQAEATVEMVCAAHAESLAAYCPTLLHMLELRALAQGTLPEDTQRALVRAISALIKALTPGAVVLSIDDWQWVDDLSHHVLRGVIGNVQARGVLVLLAARELNPNDAILAQSRARVIQLLPLHQEDSARVIRSLVPRTLDLGLAHAIHQRSGGNPLFLEELCRALPNEGPSGERALEQGQVPNTIHGVIQTRLERLPERQLGLLRAASVIGNQWSAALLEHALGEEDVASTLEALAGSDLIRKTDAGGTYRFKHGIARDVLYESVRLSERARIHAAIARALEERTAEAGGAEPYEALAYHYVGSGDHERAVRYAELAGDKAALSSSLDRARMQYGTALTELAKLPSSPEVKRRVLEVSVKWARAWVYYQAPEQLAVLERSARHAEELGDVEQMADIEQMSAWICYALGEQPRAIAHCRRGLALAERSGNPKLIGQLSSNLGQSHAAAGEYTHAIEHLSRALDLKRKSAGRRESSVPVGFAYALGVIAVVHADQGACAQAEAEMEEAFALVSDSGHAIEASLLALRAMMELWQGQFRRCVATSERACATAERIHGPYVFAMSQSMSSYARFMLDRAPEDRQKLCEAVAWLEARSMGLYLSMNYGCAAEAALLAGDRDAAADYAQRALGRAEAMDPFGQGPAQRVIAALAAERDDSPGVDAALARAFAAAEARGSQREAALTRLARAQLGRVPDGSSAREELQRLRLDFERMGMPHHRVQVEGLLPGAVLPHAPGGSPR